VGPRVAAVPGSSPVTAIADAGVDGVGQLPAMNLQGPSMSAGNDPGARYASGCGRANEGTGVFSTALAASVWVQRALLTPSRVPGCPAPLPGGPGWWLAGGASWPPGVFRALAGNAFLGQPVARAASCAVDVLPPVSPRRPWAWARAHAATSCGTRAGRAFPFGVVDCPPGHTSPHCPCRTPEPLCWSIAASCLLCGVAPGGLHP